MLRTLGRLRGCPRRGPALLLVLLLASGWALAEALEARLEAVTELRARAETRNALLLAPEQHRQGVQALDRALRERSDARALTRLDDAEAAFEGALAHVETAAPFFATALAARARAQDTEAFRFAAGAWREAETTLAEAARQLESGNREAASSLQEEAASGYALAMQTARRARGLAETRRLLDAASDLRAQRHAPRMLARSQDLEQQAADALERDPDAEASATAIEAAEQSAQRTLTIARIGEDIRRGERTLEEILLEFQDGLEAIATAADIEVDYSLPTAGTMHEAATKLASRMEESARMAQELERRDRLATGLESEVAELRRRLEDVVTERDRLMFMVQAEARIREQFAEVEALFDAAEARILRDGDKVVIRLTGLQFASGSSSLPGNTEDLMRRLARAVEVFPRASLTVEGHTDSTGSDAINQRLSEERARAVVTWLTEEGQISAARVRGEGFGPSRPIANNTTESGRAMNRRIDVVIRPNIDRPILQGSSG